MLWENNENVTKTAKKISSVYGQGVITDGQVQNWFTMFPSGDILLRDEQKSLSDVDQNALRELMKCNLCKCTRKFTHYPKTCHSTL